MNTRENPKVFGVLKIKDFYEDIWREKMKGNNCNKGFRTFISISLIILILGVAFTYYKMPKKYCNTEEKVEKWIIDDQRHFDNEEEIMCEEGVTIHNYEYINRRAIYSMLDGNVLGKMCLIKTKEKTCEIR